ncbi:hypothetical protein [Endozoicomonas sp. 4G]|uniref:hypothetical protein n=1 Tax=Endozoicomonas sp. 4G TaxID=2872754 RepID=UPI002078CE62|nr:hypothetical protein [Endozoicomonas sp. 4G]
MVTLFPLMAMSDTEGHNSSGFSLYNTAYSDDISIIDPFSARTINQSKSVNRMPELSIRQKSKINQEEVSTFVYEAISDPKKLAEQAAASAAFLGLDYIGVARPIKEGMDFIKEKTQFKFGKCSKLRFDSNVKAETCMFDNSSIELNSDYDLDSFTVNFKWQL